MIDDDAPAAWLAGFIKGITKQCYTQNITALAHDFRKVDFLCFSIVGQCGLSVAMEIKVLIRSGPKPNAAFPPTQ